MLLHMMCEVSYCLGLVHFPPALSLPHRVQDLGRGLEVWSHETAYTVNHQGGWLSPN